VIEDCDLRGGRDRGISCDGYLYGDRICEGNSTGGDVINLRGGAGGDAWQGDESTTQSCPTVELPPEIPLTLQMMEDPVVPFSVTVSVTR